MPILSFCTQLNIQTFKSLTYLELSRMDYILVASNVSVTLLQLVMPM